MTFKPPSDSDQDYNIWKEKGHLREVHRCRSCQKVFPIPETRDPNMFTCDACLREGRTDRRRE